jgi:hypothetical protein
MVERGVSMKKAGMGIYLPVGADGFELCHPVSEENFEKINREIDGTTKSSSWTPMSVQLVKKDRGMSLNTSNAPWLGAHALIFRAESIPCVQDMLLNHGELLPLACRDENLFVYNVTNKIDALDEVASSLQRFGDGRVMFIKNYSFFDRVVEGIDIFKIPNLRVSPTFLSHRFVDKWNESGQKGLEFKQVWKPKSI